MAKMTDAELSTALAPARSNADTYSQQLMIENDKFESAYLSEKTGDFAPMDNQSSAVSSDIFDTVESDMPPQARVFLGSGDIITFKPNSAREADVAEAEEKTKYINWVVRNQPESFKLIFNALKGAAIYKNSVLKYYVEDKKSVEMVEYTDVDAERADLLMESLKGADVDKVKVEIAEQDETPEEKFNIKFRVTRETKKLTIVNVRPEHFRITDDAEDIETAQLVGDTSYITRGDLVSEGYSRELVTSLAKVSINSNHTNGRENGAREKENDTNLINDWASEYVEDSDIYVKIDFDGDGIAERRRIRMSGNIILENEYYNHVPYASFSAILMPHRAIGLSRAEVVYETQRQKTSLLQGLLNNIYMVSNPRNIVHDDVDLDDMLTMRQNGIIRMESDSKILPAQAIYPLTTQYTGDASLQAMQYVDQARSQKTGDLLVSQGLDADSIAKETATKVNAITESGAAKGELIIRNYAETGFRKLFEGLAWTASRYQDSETEILVLGKQLTINPSSWLYDHKIESKVGLGAGDNDKLVQSRQAIYGIQQQLKAQGSMLVDEKGIYTNLDGITQGLGFNMSERLFNNPEEPDELLKAENEQLNGLVLQLQEQMEGMQNPFTEAETIKAQASLIKAQATQELDVAKLQSDNSKFIAKLEADNKKANDSLALRLTELEVKTNQELSAKLADNTPTTTTANI
jgi:hypothetical protein